MSRMGPTIVDEGENLAVELSVDEEIARSGPYATALRKMMIKEFDTGASDQSRHDEDVEMMDGDCIDMQDDGDAVCHNDEDQDDDDDDEEKSDEEIQDDVNEKPPVTPFPDSHRTLEQTMAMFDFGRLGAMSGQLTSHLRTLLNNIKPSASSTTRLLALQELSELLSISTEDSLAGSFQVDNFVKELVRILGGQGGNNARDEDGDEELSDDAALAAALRMSTGGALPGDDTLEAQLLACRCLANLLEALPGCGHTLVYHGAIPVLCSKLLEISYIDLAEQTLIVSLFGTTLVEGMMLNNSNLRRRWKKSQKSTRAQ